MAKSELISKKVKDFMTQVKNFEKNEKIDLSSGEDLSVAIMNLVSIEEHLFFSGQKTGQSKSYQLLKEVRELRKTLLKKIVKENEGELWCISKHLLAASMRLMEVGTKFLGQGKSKQAQELFEKSYQLYNLFWSLNLNLIKVDDVDREGEETALLVGKKDSNPEKKLNLLDKLGKIIQNVLDCCRE